MAKVRQGSGLPGVIETGNASEQTPASVTRPIGAVLFEQNGAWPTASRAMTVAAFMRIGQ